MNREEFMSKLEQHFPDDMSEEQLDALEQFSFKLYNETNISEIWN